MGDLTENIFLNTTAADKAEDEELSAFLHYVNVQTTTDERRIAEVKIKIYTVRFFCNARQ